jgi:SAM-dependent methyltransferase
MSLPEPLESSLRRYYESYYKGELGLPDWQRRVEGRLKEEEIFAEPRLDWLKNWIGLSVAGRRTLIVGAGTGAEAVALSKSGAEVFAIEPYAPAVSILALRESLNPDIPIRPVGAAGEFLPFADGAFQFIYCFAVLEHTQNPYACLDEMLRVLSDDGVLFIEVPDYRFPYDGHYKIPWIPFSPPLLISLYLRLLGRPTEFARTLRYLSFSSLRRYFSRKGVSFLRFHPPLPDYWRKKSMFWRMIWHASRITGIVPNQTLIVRKPNSAPP